MPFLADENFPKMSFQAPRDAGHDVPFVGDDSPGVDDPQVMERARREGWVILTFDRDFGELLYRRDLPVPVGVVLFRLGAPAPIEPAELLLSLMGSGEYPLEGNFTVVTRDRVRQRPL